MAAFKNLFGDKLLKGETEIPVEEALAGKKAVAIYFSAHWCPPCRGFTPKLAEWYKADLQALGLEVVFASSDKDDKAFLDYYGEQPWLALPYAQREKKDELSKKYKVQGIPTLVILNSEGETITTNGREAVSADPSGAEFPWAPKPLKEIIGTRFVTNDGKTVGAEAIEGKTIGIYFSAHWCPPCRNFTPKFAETYKKLQDSGKFEVIFVSSDKDEAAFKEYHGSMPWLALPYDDEGKKRGKGLNSHFEVNGIPNLVILDADRDVINSNAVGKVGGDPDGAKFPWAKDTVRDIDADPEGIDEMPSVILLQENLDAAAQSSNVEIAKKIAEMYIIAGKTAGADPEFNFFVANKQGSLADRVRSECSCKSTGNPGLQVVMMDIANGGKYYDFSDEFNEANLSSFLEQYKAGKLTKKQMGGDEE